MTQLREAAVAGYFYPADTRELTSTIHKMLDEVDARPNLAPKALIVPHAGYIYSGPVAASAYARLLSHRDQYTRIILLGPSHRVPFRGLATSNASVFRTPLGDVPLDREAIEGLNLPGLIECDEAHRLEHSLEVHLPFLQTVLGVFSLVPIVAGDCDPQTVAGVIEALWGGPETLIVVSTDLSHYLPYEDAQARDNITCGAIERFDAQSIDRNDACGATPLGGLLISARHRSLQLSTLDLRNSGDTAGGKEQVVGYGAWMFLER